MICLPYNFSRNFEHANTIDNVSRSIEEYFCSAEMHDQDLKAIGNHTFPCFCSNVAPKSSFDASQVILVSSF